MESRKPGKDETPPKKNQADDKRENPKAVTEKSWTQATAASPDDLE